MHSFIDPLSPVLNQNKTNFGFFPRKCEDFKESTFCVLIVGILLCRVYFICKCAIVIPATDNVNKVKDPVSALNQFFTIRSKKKISFDA